MSERNLELLNHPLAQELLNSRIPARLAYTWRDGTSRVIPIFFLWTEGEFALWTQETAPKMKALKDGTRVALTVDTNEWPCKVLLVRGVVRVVPIRSSRDISRIAERYLGEEQALVVADQFFKLFPRSYNLFVRPEWVTLLDYVERLPSAIARAMAQAPAQTR